MRAEEAMRQSQKMEAVGQLTGGLAHDFNNLLAGVSGSLELMQARMSQGRLVDLDRYMTVAQVATKRAAALTHRLLAFSRRQTLTPKPTNVNQLILGMEELIRRAVGQRPAVVVGRAARRAVHAAPAHRPPPGSCVGCHRPRLQAHLKAHSDRRKAARTKQRVPLAAQRYPLSKTTGVQAMSKRSRFITLTQASTKSSTKVFSESSWA